MNKLYRTNKTDTIKLGAEELREYEPSESEVNSIERNDIWIVIDNVLDTYNIGSIFRLADAVAARGIYLVGRSATPEDPQVGHRIHKASVGTYKWVPWQYFYSVEMAAKKLKAQSSKLKIIAVEQARGSVDYREADLSGPVALIVGHETHGVSKEGLQLADLIVELPLYGINKSLNVLVALSIVCYKIIE